MAGVSLPPPYAEAVAMAPPEYSESPPPIEIQASDQLRIDAIHIAKEVKSSIPQLNQQLQKIEDCQERVLNKQKYLEEELSSWKKELLCSLEKFYTAEKEKLTRAYKREQKRLSMYTQKISDAISYCENLHDRTSSLVRTGNENDVQDIKSKLEKLKMVVQNVNVLEIHTKVDNWDYMKPEKENMARRMKTLVGDMDVPTRDDTHVVPELESLSLDFLEELQFHPSKELSEESENIIEENTVEEETEETEPYTKLKYTLLYSFNTKTFKDKARCHPVSFIVTDHQLLVVPDRYNNKLKIFTLRGQLLEEITHNAMKSPSCITQASGGELLVSDQESNTVHIYSESGYWLRKYAGRMARPQGIAVNKWGQLVTVNGETKSVDIFDDTLSINPKVSIHHYLAPTNDPYTGKTKDQLFNFFQSPGYVAINQKDQIVVSDHGASVIQVHDREGRYVVRYGSEGSREDQFKEPYGVFVDRFQGILVADYGNHRIQRVDSKSAVLSTLVGAHLDLKFPTCVVELADRRLVVSEYLSGLIKVFGSEDHIAQSEQEDLPPSYSSIASPAPTLVNQYGDLYDQALHNPTFANPYLRSASPSLLTEENTDVAVRQNTLSPDQFSEHYLRSSLNRSPRTVGGNPYQRGHSPNLETRI